MLEILKRNGALLAVLGAALLLFFTTTLPALKRKQAMAEMYREQRMELQRLEAEAQRLELLKDALEIRDPPQFDRALQHRFAPALQR